MYENESYILKAACHKCCSPRKNDKKKVINAYEKVENDISTVLVGPEIIYLWHGCVICI